MRQTLSRGVFAAAAATGILSLYGTPALADSFAGGGAEDSPGVLSGNNVQVPVHVPVNACGNTVTVVGALTGAHDNTCVNASKSEHGGSGHGGSEHGRSVHGGSGGAHAEGGTKGSPGVGSGNNVQAPVHVPVNVCGNSISGVALFQKVSGNVCANVSDHGAHKAGDHSSDSSYGDSHGGSYAHDGAKGSPGVGAGNNVQAPVHVPVNVCGNTVGLITALNAAYGNTCVNETGYGEDDAPGYGEDGPGYGEEDVPEKETPEPPVKVKTPPAPGAEEPPAEAEPGNPPHLAETGSAGVLAASAAGAVMITGGAMLYRRGRLAARR
ncbi:LPXTG-motif cell wall-anchored protein [Streptomyces calvus]|uniref:chaplin n=1 Tax=Streptomyces calvus TaxID=67282 RepID=UPI0035167BC5